MGHVVGSIATVVLFPAWGVLGSIGALVMSPMLLTCDVRVAASFMFFSALLFSGIFATIISLDHALVLSSGGLAFPLLCIPSLKGRRERNWSDLARIRFIQRDNEPLNRGKLDLIFRSGGHVVIDLKCLKDEAVEQILLALEVWGKNADKDPELLTLANTIHDGQHLKGIASFTSMWEEEMGRRFSSTAFVPLSNGTELLAGRLRVVRQLAFGGLSAIYLAQLNQTETVVLKEFIVPDADERLREKAAELFNREASLLTKLSHPRVARVRDHFVEDDRTYLMLDYIPGADLRQIVKQRGPQSELQVRRWAEQLAEILQYLHCQNPPVIHRDLTPDNVVLTSNETIVLIDFGAANEYIGTATGTLVGKQSFIAPEQFRGDTTLSSDIYSLGSTLFFLLTGQDPEALSPSSPRAVNPDISEEIDRLVADCTAFDECDRIASAEELRRRLGALSAVMVST